MPLKTTKKFLKGSKMSYDENDDQKIGSQLKMVD